MNNLNEEYVIDEVKIDQDSYNYQIDKITILHGHRHYTRLLDINFPKGTHTSQENALVLSHLKKALMSVDQQRAEVENNI